MHLKMRRIQTLSKTFLLSFHVQLIYYLFSPLMASRKGQPPGLSLLHLFIKFIKTSQIILSYGTHFAWSIHYGFLSWQAIWIERHLVHYAHMKPITPPAMTNSSNIYLLPSEQCVNLLVNPQPWLLWKMGEKWLFFPRFHHTLVVEMGFALLFPCVCLLPFFSTEVGRGQVTVWISETEWFKRHATSFIVPLLLHLRWSLLPLHFLCSKGFIYGVKT